MSGIADWLDATHYHLCLDTSVLPLPEIAGLAVELICRKRQGGG